MSPRQRQNEDNQDVGIRYWPCGRIAKTSAEYQDIKTGIKAGIKTDAKTGIKTDIKTEAERH